MEAGCEIEETFRDTMSEAHAIPEQFFYNTTPVGFTDFSGNQRECRDSLWKDF